MMTHKLAPEHHRTELLQAYFLLAMAVVIIFVPVFYQLLTNHYSDFIFHIRQAKRISEQGSIEGGHFLFAALVAGLRHLIVGINYREAALALVLIAQLATVLILFHRFRLKSVRYAAWGALALCLVAPIQLLAVVDGRLYRGYVPITSYHNPTILLLRPFALLLFFYCLKAFNSRSLAAKDYLLAAIVAALGVLAKPSFALALIPALGMMTIWELCQRNRIDLKMLLTICTVLLGVMFWQYSVYYGEGSRSSVIWAPFVVQGHHSDWLLLKLLLSCAFPLTVYFFYYRQTRFNSKLNLAWLIYLISLFYRFFLAESGERIHYGNFGWSSHIAGFILFVVSFEMIASVKKEKNENLLKQVVIWSLFCLHTYTGILFYLFYFTLNEKFL